MSIDFWLLHQVLKTFLLEQLLLLLLLLLAHFLIELFFLSLQVSQLTVALPPKVHHVFSQLFRPCHAFLYYSLRFKRLFPQLTLRRSCKLLWLCYWIAVVLLKCTVGLWYITFRNLSPHSLNCACLHFFSGALVNCLECLGPIVKEIVDDGLIKFRLLRVVKLIWIEWQRQNTAAI